MSRQPVGVPAYFLAIQRQIVLEELNRWRGSLKVASPSALDEPRPLLTADSGLLIADG
jgi:hypothetical protein